MIIWGATDIGVAADTRYLPPGFSLVVVPTTVLEVRADEFLTLRGLRVHHNTPSADATPISYRVRINGVDTALLVSVPGNASDGANLVDDVDLMPGDFLALVAVKAAVILSGALDVTVTVEDI